MTSLNSHVEEFLDYYCNLKNSPEYAVLLKGDWGCGKTWFIKNYFKKLEESKRKYLYVSLYGVTNYTEIENSFFQQLHPILSHKGMALAGKILKGALRATIKVDLDGDGKPDVSNTSNVPDINLPNYLSNADGNILVFDDLERCRIKKQDMLGYINHFVEHQGFKVIIIANEEDIKSKDDPKDKAETQYKIVKEKLIGKSFEIVSCFDDSFKEFVKVIERRMIIEFLNDNFDTVKECYTASGYNNLRHLKQSLWDFERFSSKIPDDKISNKAFGKHLLQLFLSLSFEIKSAFIDPEEINKITSGYFEDAFDKKDDGDDQSIYGLITKKYHFIFFYEPIFDFQIWNNFFSKGIVDGDGMNQAIDRSRYFKENNDLNWVKLWHCYDLEDHEFEDLYKVILEELASRKHEEVGVIIHVFGILMTLSDIGIIRKTKSDILNEAKGYVDILKINNHILRSQYDIHDPFEDEAWGGLSFHGKELSEFKELKEYISRVTEIAKDEILPDKGRELLDLMRNDVDEFYRMITGRNHNDYYFNEKPVLSAINPKDFATILLKLSKKSQRIIAKSLLERYRTLDFKEKLIYEKKWLEELKKILHEEQLIKDGTLSGFAIKNIIEHSIDKSIARFC